jgi:hypothetical protein
MWSVESSEAHITATAGWRDLHDISVVRVGFSDRLQEAALAARTLSDGASDPVLWGGGRLVV